MHKRNIKGERPIFTLVQIVTILFHKNGIIRLKLMHSCVTEFLKYNQCETDINEMKTRQNVTEK
jgi:hypothetical protein